MNRLPSHAVFAKTVLVAEICVAELQKSTFQVLESLRRPRRE